MDLSIDSLSDVNVVHTPFIKEGIDLEIRPGTLELAKAFDLFTDYVDLFNSEDRIDEELADRVEEELALKKQELFAMFQQAIDLDPNNHAARWFRMSIAMTIGMPVEGQEEEEIAIEKLIQDLTFLIDSGAYNRDSWVIASEKSARMFAQDYDEEGNLLPEEIVPVNNTELFAFSLNIPEDVLYFLRSLVYANFRDPALVLEDLRRAAALGNEEAIDILESGYDGKPLSHSTDFDSSDSDD